LVSDLIPDATKSLPSGYPRDRLSLDRALDTLVTRGLASREPIAWASRQGKIKEGGRNPLYVYLFPSIAPVNAMTLQIWLAADPMSMDQNHNFRHQLPRKEGTPKDVFEYLELELLTPEGVRWDRRPELYGLLRATFPSITKALMSLEQPALLVARVDRSELNTEGPARSRAHKSPVPSGRTMLAKPTPLGTEPKEVRRSKRTDRKTK
jgi:hypothetical protein